MAEAINYALGHWQELNVFCMLTVIRKRIFPVIGRQGLCGLA
jgi:hypothetical protein